VATLRVPAFYGEVLVGSGGATAKVTKQGLEVAVDNATANTDAQLKAVALYAEAIVASHFPQLVRVSKQALEVAVNNGAANTAATLKVAALYAEAMFGVSSTAQVTKQALEVLVDNGAANPLATLRVPLFHGEILAQRGPTPPVPLTDPVALDFFVHNWAATVEMTTSYRTDIVPAQESMSEDRRALWSRPERVIRIRWLQSDPEFIEHLTATLRRIPNERLCIPLYQDQMEVTASSGASDTIFGDTTNKRFFVGQRVAIVYLQSDGSRVASTDLRRIIYLTATSMQLDSATSNAIAPHTMLVFPTMDTEINLESSVAFITETVGETTLELTEVLGPSALPPLSRALPAGMLSYAGKPIWNFEHDWSHTFLTRYVREGQKTTQGRGQIINTQGERHRLLQEYKIGPYTREDFWPFVQFFDWCLGRAKSFWVIDQENNWTIETTSSGTIDITPTGDFDEFNVEMGFIGIVMNDGTRIVRQVDDVEDLGSVYRLTLHAPSLPMLDYANDTRMISRARISRFNTDELKEVWSTDGVADATTELIETLEEKDVIL
jgi:hypothetical protein